MISVFNFVSFIVNIKVRFIQFCKKLLVYFNFSINFVFFIYSISASFCVLFHVHKQVSFESLILNVYKLFKLKNTHTL